MVELKVDLGSEWQISEVAVGCVQEENHGGNSVVVSREDLKLGFEGITNDIVLAGAKNFLHMFIHLLEWASEHLGDPKSACRISERLNKGTNLSHVDIVKILLGERINLRDSFEHLRLNGISLSIESQIVEVGSLFISHVEIDLHLISQQWNEVVEANVSVRVREPLMVNFGSGITTVHFNIINEFGVDVVIDWDSDNTVR